MVDCSCLGGELLPQAKEFKYIGLMFSQVMGKWSLRWTGGVVWSQQYYRIFRSICGHELWVVTERARLWVQASEMISFVGWQDSALEMRSSYICGEIRIEMLLLKEPS